jgi:predicted N-acetyltransferase YhbS
LQKIPEAPALVAADGALHEHILDQTHAVWSDGLDRARYGQYNKAQLATRWGARHLKRLALLEADQVLASAKRYDLTATLDGRVVAVAGIGAVFTPPELRGHGFGQQIVNSILDEARRDGCGLALLFSEIGTPYYERLGFTAVPLAACELTVGLRSGAPAIPMRTGDDRDLRFLADVHASRGADYRFSLRYDVDWLQYSIAKRRLLCGLGPPGARAVEFLVAEEGTRPVAWILLHVEGSERPGDPERWTLESCGDRDPTGARVGAMLQALLARTPAAAHPRIRAWWPSRLNPPQLQIRPRGASSITMMIRALREDIRLDPPLDRETTLYWHADAF